MYFYLAYGSNLHPLRLGERAPSAALVGAVELKGYCLMFNKRGADGSGKCNLRCTRNPADRAYGAIYRLSARHKSDLDRVEGVGNGYRNACIRLHLKGELYHCHIYLAEPSHIDEALRPFNWYKKLVILGADHLGFPQEYLSYLSDTAEISDPDRARSNRNHCLAERMAGGKK